MNSEQIHDFEQYVKAFYGTKGLHKQSFPPNGATDSEVHEAVLEYIKATIKSEGVWTKGDTIDRTNVKWIIMDNRRKRIEAQILELQRELSYYPEALPNRERDTLSMRTYTM